MNTRAANLADKADDLAVLAAMELLEIGWTMDAIAQALMRPVEWINAAIDGAIADDDALASRSLN